MGDQASVEVTGYGSASTVPDRVRLHLAAVSRAGDVGEAFQRADTGLKAMLAALHEHRVASGDIRTSHIDVQSNRGGRGGPSGFAASMGVEVTLRDIGAAGRVVSAAVDAGGNASRVRGFSLTSSAPDDALVQARHAAWADAVAKAREYAGLAGRELGDVLMVSEGGGYGDDAVPVAFAASSRASIEPGVQTVQVAVRVRWQLR